MVKGLGKKLKSAREQYGYTQEEIARNAGISKNHLSAIENDRRGVTSKTLDKILTHLHIRQDMMKEAMKKRLQYMQIKTAAKSMRAWWNR